MKKFDKIEQGSLEWFEIKWGKIGGTLSGGLFVKSDTLLIDILSQKLEDFEPYEDSFKSSAMERGNEMEPFAIEYLENYTGIKFEKAGWLESNEFPLLGISPDGISECNRFAAETKCLARKKHTEILLTQEIPSEHIKQVLHYFTVNPKLEKMYYCAFRPESVKNFVKELTLDSVINLGTKARPVLKTVQEWVEVAKKAATELTEEINTKITELNF